MATGAMPDMCYIEQWDSTWTGMKTRVCAPYLKAPLGRTNSNPYVSKNYREVEDAVSYLHA